MRDAEYRHAVETAARLGASIEAEYLHPNGNKYWVACETPRWDWHVGDYRVEPPEPAKPREFWIATDSLGNQRVYTSRFDFSSHCSIVHVREVLAEAKPEPRKPRECWIWAGVAYESRPGFPSATLFREVLE